MRGRLCEVPDANTGWVQLHVSCAQQMFQVALHIVAGLAPEQHAVLALAWGLQHCVVSM